MNFFIFPSTSTPHYLIKCLPSIKSCHDPIAHLFYPSQKQVQTNYYGFCLAASAFLSFASYEEVETADQD